jgi:hypothetical protein
VTTTYRRGDTVTINDPDNPRLHGAKGMVRRVVYGEVPVYHVSTPAAATGWYRALAEELVPAAGSINEAREQGWTGDQCPQCSSYKMRRNGSCLLCSECGSTTGCS